jgi:hypothetical protein
MASVSLFLLKISHFCHVVTDYKINKCNVEKVSNTTMRTTCLMKVHQHSKVTMNNKTKETDILVNSKSYIYIFGRNSNQNFGLNRSDHVVF